LPVKEEKKIENIEGEETKEETKPKKKVAPKVKFLTISY